MVSTWRKFFFNLEKQKAINTTVRHLIEDSKDIADFKESMLTYVINAYICKFRKNLSIKNVSKLDLVRNSFLNSIVLPILNSKIVDIYESEIANT